MFSGLSIDNELAKYRQKMRTEDEVLIQEVNKILQKDLLSDKKILDNLKHYNKSFHVLNEDECDPKYIFTLSEIRQIAIHLKLRFLDSSIFKGDIPYEAILKIKDLNRQHVKELNDFRVLSTFTAFSNRSNTEQKALFALTDTNTYYLIHTWGDTLPWYRKLTHWPLRNFETLFVSLLIITCILALGLPTSLISLDPKAEYWSGWRIATFFHLLIFNMGVTAYITFTFSKNFHSSLWNSNKDF